MERMKLGVFIGQVTMQCEAAVAAERRIRAALDASSAEAFIASPDAAAGASYELWHAIQDFVTAAANVAKAFWGSGAKKAGDRTELREYFKIDDASPIKDVAMRNNFEHFDERIDTWWDNSPRRMVLDRIVGHGVRVEGDPLGAFRALDLDTLELTFWDERYSLPAIFDEIHRLLAAFGERLAALRESES
jgi:hypothetical protein